MMRAVLTVLATLAFGAALVMDWMAGQVIWPTTIGAAIVLAGMLFERSRYKRVLDVTPGAGWQATDERFIDPDSGKTVTVYFNPATGERRYVSIAGNA